MTNQFQVPFNTSNTVYKTWFTLSKFNFELKLRNIKKSFVLEIGYVGTQLVEERIAVQIRLSWVEKI